MLSFSLTQNDNVFPRLVGYEGVISSFRQLTALHNSGRTFSFMAETSDEAKEWVQVLLQRSKKRIADVHKLTIIDHWRENARNIYKHVGTQILVLSIPETPTSSCLDQSGLKRACWINTCCDPIPHLPVHHPGSSFDLCKLLHKCLSSPKSP